jgi:hypothetical protein
VVIVVLRLSDILTVYAVPVESPEEWQPPKPRRLGWKGLSDADLKAEAQLTGSELTLIRR